ncbi:MAG TPA: MFS transporter [Stellaceae bacterium]|nr:MFS transporter [Stellaceae bacterium]
MAAAGVVYGLYNVSLTTILAYGPLMLVERGWTFAAASSVTSLVLWIVTLSLPGGGYLADRTGQRGLILVGGLFVFSAAMALAPRTDAALPVFALLGIASGLPCGAIMSLPTRILSPATRAARMGILLTVYYVINVCGPWLIGRIAELSGSPRFAFDVSAIALCGAIVFWFIFRRLANRSSIAEEAKAAG